LKQEREAGHDTSTESFKAKVAEIKKQAEDAEMDLIQKDASDIVRNITRSVNKLHALIKLKSKITTINDWYKLASEKFGLNIKRPDAKLITKNIEKQIK